MKVCFKCKKLKPLIEFYSHPKMMDGRLNKCKCCTKQDVKNREADLKNDPEHLVKERLRGRIKYHKYKYKSNKNKYMVTQNNRAKYPEKYQGHIAAQRIEKPAGFENHHWSYNPDHLKDVIQLQTSLHAKLHRYMSYDPKSKMYKTLEGSILDSRDKHEKFIEVIKEIP